MQMEVSGHAPVYNSLIQQRLTLIQIDLVISLRSDGIPKIADIRQTASRTWRS